MNALISGGALAVAGTSVVGSVASGIVANTANILSYLWYGSSSNLQLRDYHRRITKLDITDKVKLVSAMLETPDTYPMVIMMDAGLKSVTETILRQLSDIQIKLEGHADKWFSSYRNLYIDEEIKDLEALVSVLDNKMLLIKVKG
jgi:hypothetical protein